jgi:TRAP-type transport system periplasmic protein
MSLSLRIVITVLFVSMASTSCFAASPLKVVTFSGKESVWNKNMEIFFEHARQDLPEVRFRQVGGPEAIPPFEQIEALRRGIVDVALLPAAYFVPQLPQADAMKLSPFLPWEERDKGIFDYYNKLMQEKLGVFYLGKITGGIKYRFYLKKAIQDPHLSGLKIRVTPIYEPFVRALRGIPVTMAPGEVYIALERGVVDGFGWPSIGIRDQGWQEAIRYVVEPGFYQTDVCILFNLKSWNRLKASTRKKLQTIMVRVEKESHALSRNMELEEAAFLSERGIVTIRFDKSANEQYLEEAYEAGWTKIASRSPNDLSTLRTLMKRRP